MRLFVGIDVSSAVAAALVDVRLPRSGKINVIGAPDMHVTLHFLGRADQPAVEAALATVRADCFRIAVRGLGEFRMRSGRRILWAGVEPSASLDALHSAVAAALSTTGFDPESRPYKPHVTLARIGPNAPRQAIAALLEAHRSTGFGSVDVTELVLYDTAESGSAARYRRVRRYPLDTRRIPV